MKKLVPVLIVLIAGCPSDQPTDQSATEIKNLVARSIVIDVRTAQEFNDGHIDGAVNIPYDEIGGRITEVTNDKHQSIVLYCRSGRRSGIALDTLKAMGYTQLENAGGYTTLKQKLAQ